MGRFVGRIRALALTLGAPGLFLVAFLDSSFLPLPGITDVLLVVTGTRHPAAMLWSVALTAAGSGGWASAPWPMSDAKVVTRWSGNGSLARRSSGRWPRFSATA